MKTKKLLTFILAIMMLPVMQVSAQSQKDQKQKGERTNKMKVLNLSEKQESQAKEFQVEMKKKITPIQLDVKEKEIQLQKLMIADEVDEKAVFALVDEISGLKTQIQKARLQSKIQFRTILTDEQRIQFDAIGMDKKKEKRKTGKEKPQKQVR